MSQSVKLWILFSIFLLNILLNLVNATETPPAQAASSSTPHSTTTDKQSAGTGNASTSLPETALVSIARNLSLKLQTRLDAIDALGQLGKASPNTASDLQKLMQNLIADKTGQTAAAQKAANDYNAQKDKTAATTKYVKSEFDKLTAAKTELVEALVDQAQKTTAASAAKAEVGPKQTDVDNANQGLIVAKTKFNSAKEDLLKNIADAATKFDEATKALLSAQETLAKAEQSLKTAQAHFTAAKDAATSAVNNVSTKQNHLLTAVQDYTVAKSAADAATANSASATAISKPELVSNEWERALLAVHIIQALGNLGKSAMIAIPEIVQISEIDATLEPYAKKAIQDIQNDASQSSTSDLGKSIDTLGTSVNNLGTSLGKISDLRTKIDALTKAVEQLKPKTSTSN